MATAARAPITMPAIAPPEIEDEELLPAAAEFVGVVEVGVDDVDTEVVVDVEVELEVELEENIVGVGVGVEIDEDEESASEYI
jgi:hypothetical protein